MTGVCLKPVLKTRYSLKSVDMQIIYLALHINSQAR